MKQGALDSLARLDEITRRLRRECPWDREQDARSIVPHTVEESYELADAAARDDAEAMLDELGDVLFQVLFLSLLLEERGEGDLGAVAESCAAKLIRRHPHVYGQESGGASSASRPGAPELASAGEVLAQWERIKREVEGEPEPHRRLPENMPALLRARKARELMLAGVTIHAPETVRIDPDVTVGADTEIEPGAILRGHTRIGKNCSIGAYSVITDSELANEVTIRPFSVIMESRIARGATIGPFAHLRPGADIGDHARVGNFVELKKTRLGRGSKASHLTYLGDAVIGNDVNIGCGTTTVNYDGAHKHQTVVEDNAFIGSGANLIAPVRVGRNAFVAAGSTITHDVPANALAIGRARQAIKLGWATRRKKKVGRV